MEIYPLNNSGFKIKGKSATLTTDFEAYSVTVGEFVVEATGEYEVAGVTILAGEAYYKIIIDNVNICFLGNSAQKVSDEQLAQIGSVDILLLLAKKDEIIAKVEPLVVVTTDKVAGIVPQPKFVTSKDKLPETTTVVVLE